MDYAELDELITGYLPNVTSDEDKAALAKMLTRASRALDSRTRRAADAFAPAPDEASTQVWSGAGLPVLITGEYIKDSVASVTAPQGYMPAAWAEFRRRDVTTGALHVGLHTAMAGGILTPRVPWAKGVPFTVTARWGFEEPPGEIIEACLKLTREWWRQQVGEVAGPVGDLQQFRRPERGFPKEVDDLLAPYVLPDFVEQEEEGTIEVG